MIGVAAEGMILNLRDILVARLRAVQSKQKITKALEGWKIKEVCEELEKLLVANQKNMPSDLSSEFDIYWNRFTSNYRTIYWNRFTSNSPEAIKKERPANSHGLKTSSAAGFSPRLGIPSVRAGTAGSRRQ